MKVEVFTGVAPDFKLLTTAELHCPSCGVRVRVPTEMMVRRIADRIEEHYQKQNAYLVEENRKLREIIQFGHQVELIKRMADKL